MAGLMRGIGWYHADFVAGVTPRPSTCYFGAAGDGIWKTTDSGATWVPVSDG
jgi:hypothetical protein